MPFYGWGGSTSGGSFSAGTLFSDGVPLPSGRAMSNGSTAVLIDQLYAYVRGHSANPVGTIQLGSSITGAVTATSAGDSTPGIGYFASSAWLVNGGTARFQWNGPSTGPVWIGKGGGGTVNGPSGYSRAGTLGGAAHYSQAPSAIDTPTLSAGPGQLIIDFAGPADNGDSAIIDYVIQYTTDATFATGVTTATTTSGHNVYSVTPGQLYYARIYSRNAVTNAAGAWSAVSGTGSARVGIGGKRWDGTAEQPFTTAVRWDGSAEVPITTAVRWDGSAEVPLT
jgi:hypothetical protein